MTEGPRTVSRDEYEALLRSHEQTQLKLKGIEDISRALGSEHNIDRILDTVMERTTRLLDAARSTLFIFKETDRVLWSRNTQGGEVATIELPAGQGIAGWVALHGRSVNVKDVYKDPRFDQTHDARTGFRTKSILCAPLRDAQQRIIGVIEVMNKSEGYFTPADEELLAAIAAQAAISIHNSRLYLDLVGKNIDLMETSMRLEARKAEMELLFKVERGAAMASNLDDAISQVISPMLDEFPSEAAAVVLRDERTGALVVQYSAGERSDIFEADRLEQLADSLVHRVLHSGQAQRYVRLTEAYTDEWTPQQAIAVPIANLQESLGVVILVNRLDNPRGFEEDDARILGLICARLGLAIALARAMEEEQKAERLAAVGKTLSGVIHDLKTPLTIIAGYSRAMVKESDTDSRQALRSKIKRQIESMKEMTGELLAFARGDSQVFMRKVYVRTFLDELRELLSEEFGDSGVTLEVTDSYGGTLRMDENKMKRVVFNLARNAREAMPEGGLFCIHVARDAAHILFEFSDNGPGIPEELEGRLFESFATHGKAEGTGLGLAIVKKLVEAQGGTITVRSLPQEGTTFTVRLNATMDT